MLYLGNLQLYAHAYAYFLGFYTAELRDQTGTFVQRYQRNRVGIIKRRNHRMV